MKTLILTTALLLGILPLCAQTSEDSDTAIALPNTNTQSPKFKVKKQSKAAGKLLRKGNIYAASDLFEKVMQHDPENAEVAYKLAESYRIARDYKKAEQWYKRVSEMDPVSYPDAAFWMALMMKMNGKYSEARRAFDDFARTYKGPATYLKKWAQTESRGCELALQLMEQPLPLNIYHLDRRVNSPYTDIAPLLWDDTTLLFASLPSDTVIVLSGNEVDHFIKLYKATRLGRHAFDTARVFELFNRSGYHVANGCLSPDRQRFYFTQCSENEKNGKIICAIYMSQRENGSWSEPTPVSAEINLPGYTSTHPWVAPARKGFETLYFASDRPEGKGGLDLWVSSFNISRKTFSTPKNLGAKINTDRDEATPYFDAVSGTLFFSSNGHVGMGGYDVFKTEGSGSRYSDPVNIGYPLNSSTDEMYFRMYDDGRSGFFVSNRPGIISIRSETCCDDIFSFEYIQTIHVAVMGYVYDEDDTTHTPIENARVALSLESPEGILQNIHLGDDTIVNGQRYYFSLNVDKNYRVSGSAEGYLTNSVPFHTHGIVESDTLYVDIYLKKKVLDKAYRLKNIYYDFDKWDLREASKLTLDTLYNIMIENPTIIVEIGSHTDTRATDQYNLSLSQKRAESCVNYLISKGIPKTRLQAKGYGETRLLDDCRKYPECPQDNSGDCPCHQNNRRTEFKIIGELDAELIYEDERYEEKISRENTPAPADKKKERN
ncbi:MAG: cell envelope biogenesis protein OmpA [Chitinophagales bacterium]|nr:MAG: cell envelope biogenesis protein OmpA [Chitinophagales bacterium]